MSKRILSLILSNIVVIAGAMWWLMELKKDTEYIQKDTGYIREAIDANAKERIEEDVDQDERITAIEHWIIRHLEHHAGAGDGEDGP